MSDSLIRDLLVNVKQTGATKATTSINKLNTAVQAVEKSVSTTNEQLTKLEGSLNRVDAAARKAQSSLGRLASIRGLDATVAKVSALAKQIDKLSSSSTSVSTTLTSAFGKVSNSISRVTSQLNKLSTEGASALRSTSSSISELNSKWEAGAKSANVFSRSVALINSNIRAFTSSIPLVGTGLTTVGSSAGKATAGVTSLSNALSHFSNNGSSGVQGLATALAAISTGPAAKSPKVIAELAAALKALPGATNSVNGLTSGMATLGAQVTAVSTKLQTVRNTAGQVTSALAKLTVGPAALSSITNVLAKIQALTPATAAATASMQTGFGLVNVSILALSTTLNALGASGIGNIQRLSVAIKGLGSGGSAASRSVETVAKSVNTLAVQGKAAAMALRNLAAPLSVLNSSASGSAAGITSIGVALSRINSAGSQIAILSGLAKALSKLSTGGAGKAAENINKVGEALRRLPNSANNSFRGFTSSLAEANNQVTSLEAKLIRLAAAAEKAGKAGRKINFGGGLGQISQKLTEVLKAIDLLTGHVVSGNEKMVKGFNLSRGALNRMSNELGRTMDNASDHIITLNGSVNRVNGSLNDLSRNGSRANRVLGGTSGSAQGAGRQFAKLAREGGGLTIMYAAIAANVYVLKAAFDQFRAGDQLNRLMEFGTVMGSITGTPIQSLAKALQEATNHAVSFENAMSQASTAAAYGFDSKQISEFGKVARRAAAVLGIDMTDALNRVIKGVSKQEIELLDELGVTIRLNDAYAKYVQVLNSAGDGTKYNIQTLTSYQKQQAYANAVVAESNKRFGMLDDLLRATPWEDFGANAESALKRLQAASAKWLTPVIQNINQLMYTTKSSQFRSNADARIASSEVTDPKNYTSLVTNAKGARDDLAEYNKLLDENREKVKAIKAERAKIKDQQDKTLLGGVGNYLTAAFGGGDELQRREVELASKESELGKEYAEILDTQKKLKTAVDVTTTALQKNQAVWKQVKGTIANDPMDIPGTPGKVTIDDKALDAVTERYKNFTNTVKNTAPDVMASFDAMTSGGDLKKVYAGMAGVLKDIEGASDGTKESLDDLAKSANIRVDSYSELANRVKALKDAADATGDSDKQALKLEEARNTLLKSGKSTKEATTAVTKMEVGMLDQQISKMEALRGSLSNTAALDNEIVKLRTKRFQLLNSEYSTEKKAEKVKTKAVGIERQIELAQDTVLNSEQFELATLQAQLEVHKDKAAKLKDVAAQQADYKTELLAIAQTERQIRDTNYQQAMAVSDRNREFKSALTLASQEYSEREQSAMRVKDIEQQIADLRAISKDKGVALDTTRETELKNQLALEKANAAKAETEAKRGVQNTTTNLLGGTYGSTLGMSPEQTKMQEFQNNQDGYSQAISNLQSINSEATNAANSVGNLVNALMQYSQGSLDFTSVAAAGMQMVSQFVSYGANQQISAIDAAIAAEQARDGQSEESKAKIKKMEAEKIKIQQDSAKKQILIQTAVAVMQAANAVPFPWSIPLMVAAAAAGAMSYAQASNASSSTLSGLDSSASTASLTLGQRNNSVDVSQRANAGELSYVQGGKGVGNANTFVPRAEGGNMIPGVGYITGENGTEVITPNVPSTATPVSDLAKANAATTRPVHLTINALDARSFRDMAMENPAIFRDAVEMALNENGTSLDRL